EPRYLVCAPVESGEICELETATPRSPIRLCVPRSAKASDASSASVTGQLVDEHRRPLAEVECSCLWRRYPPPAWDLPGAFPIKTDAGGRFVLPVAPVTKAGVLRMVAFRRVDSDAASAAILLPPAITTATRELGAIVLESPAQDRSELSRLSD